MVTHVKTQEVAIITFASMLIIHDSDTLKGQRRPVFSWQDKLRRYTWNVCWILLCRWTPIPLHPWRVWVIRQFGGRIGEQNHIYPNCTIWAPWLLETGNVVTIGPRVEVYNPGSIHLGHYAILSQGAYLCGATHDYDSPDFTYVKKKITLEPHVWICANATVLPGVYCAEGSVLGAAAVTARHLDAWTVYAGSPARAIKARKRVSV